VQYPHQERKRARPGDGIGIWFQKESGNLGGGDDASKDIGGRPYWWKKEGVELLRLRRIEWKTKGDGIFNKVITGGGKRA